MTSDRKRMESDIHAMQRDLDDAISSRRAAEDRADKLALDLNRAQDQLRLEQDNYNNAESLRKQLEVQLREITIRLDEAESTKDGKKPIAKLQARVCTLTTFTSSPHSPVRAVSCRSFTPSLRFQCILVSVLAPCSISRYFNFFYCMQIP